MATIEQVVHQLQSLSFEMNDDQYKAWKEAAYALYLKNNKPDTGIRQGIYNGFSRITVRDLIRDGKMDPNEVATLIALLWQK